MTGLTHFEHPLNEKSRTLLRLSRLFEQLDFHSPHADEWHARCAVSSVLDIASILARADIKSELIKDVERYSTNLSRMADTPGVDSARLEHILQNLHSASHAVRTVQGQLGQALRSNDFLNAIQQRSSIAGGCFDFDLPQYHHWLRLPQAERAIQLDDWRNEIAPVQEAVDLLLGLIRASTTPTREQAAGGFFQRNVPTQLSAQIVRVGIPEDIGVYAEISGGKHRFSVRFMECSDLEHPTQCTREITFQLSICVA